MLKRFSLLELLVISRISIQKYSEVEQEIIINIKMVDYKIKHLVISPFIKIEWLEKKSKAKISNIISGKVFEIGSIVVEILEFVRRPKTWLELADRFQLDNAVLEKTIAFLLAKGLILDEEHQEGATITVTPVQNRLFQIGNLYMEKQVPQVSFVGVPFGKGNSQSTGSRNFPYKLREIVQQYNLDCTGSINNQYFRFLDQQTDFSNLKYLFEHQLVSDFGNIFINSNEGESFVYDKIFTIADELFTHKVVPFFIGGDHSISYPLIKAALNNYNDLHVIHFDAHTDTYRSSYDSIIHQNKVHHHGNFVTKCLEDPRFNHIYQFGIRGIANLGQKAQPQQNIFWYSETKRTLSEGRTFDLPENVPYYVTFDIDVLDPGIAPGTATPVPGGFNFEDIKILFGNVLKNKKIVGIDFVEANPDYDRTDLTTQTAIQVILYLLNLIKV